MNINYHNIFHFFKNAFEVPEAPWRVLENSDLTNTTHESGQLYNVQGSAQNENVEPLIQKAGKKLFLSSHSFSPDLTQGFPLLLLVVIPQSGELLRPGQTLTGTRGSILWLRWDSYQTRTLPANMLGPHREWRVAVVMRRLEGGGWAGPGTRGKGVGGWEPVLGRPEGAEMGLCGSWGSQPLVNAPLSHAPLKQIHR